MKQSVSEKLKQDIEECAAAVKAIKQAAFELSQNTEAQRVLVEKFEDNLNAVRRSHFVDGCREDLALLQRRIDRIKELRNIQELASFEITVGHVVQKAWEELP